VELRPGSRWRSAVCETEVVVVRSPGAPLELECGGHPMAQLGAERPHGLALAPAHAGGTQVGKRYVDQSGLEVLCTKTGAGSLSVGGRPMATKEPKKLPSSD
jgi:hypothetical protein